MNQNFTNFDDDFLSTTSQENYKTGRWSPEEGDCLRAAVNTYGEGHWKEISALVPGRSALQCLHRWTKALKPGLIKGHWTPEENALLREWVKNNGPQRWSECAKIIVGRSGKQCREHWCNKLNPTLKKGNWTAEEDEQIFRLYQKYGTSWSRFEKFLPGRTENAIKNRFYSALRRLESNKGAKRVKKDDNSSSMIDQIVSSQPSEKDSKTEKATSSAMEITVQAKLTNALQSIPDIKGGYPSFHVKFEENTSQTSDERVTRAEIESEEPVDYFSQGCSFIDYSNSPKVNLNTLEGWSASPKLFEKSDALKFDFHSSPKFDELNVTCAPQNDLEISPTEVQNALSEMYEKVNNFAGNSAMTNEEKIHFYMNQLKFLDELFSTTKKQVIAKLNDLKNEGACSGKFLNSFYKQFSLLDK